MDTKPNTPIQTLNSSMVRAAIWCNEVEGVKKFSVKIEKSFFDKKAGEYRNTNHYFPTDMEHLSKVVDDVTEYLKSQEGKLPTMA